MLTVVFLILTIVLIVLVTTKFKLHPFLTLLLAALLVGFLGGLDVDAVLAGITEGFGGTLKSIGIVIACGTVIGTYLEKSGGAKTLAASVLGIVGEKQAPLAMSITGFVVSIPVFCDSGFVILSPLNKALSRKTGISLSVLAVALATGLYATHVFVPPTPGPLAAAATLNADIGLVIILGLVVSIPATAIGYFWGKFYGKRFSVFPEKPEAAESNVHTPGAIRSFSPLLIPVALIAFKSIADYPGAPFGKGLMKGIFDFAGHPVIALIIGVFLAFFLKERGQEESHFDWVALGLKNAGIIILITGAGGAFGSVLRATDINDAIGQSLSQWKIGILLPFFIAALLKTAQGSSTVAIITTAAIVSPLLDPMGLTAPLAKALVVLAIGAGSMTVSHVNDSYFWVVAQFSHMDTATALRCHTAATLLQGVGSVIFILGLSWILL
jgi:GntP family gluconate:H+ symporter